MLPAIAAALIGALGSIGAAAVSGGGTNNTQNPAGSPTGPKPADSSPFSQPPTPPQADVQAPDQQPVPQNATVGDILSAIPPESTGPTHAPAGAAQAAQPANQQGTTTQQVMEGVGAALRNPAVLQMLGLMPQQPHVAVLPIPPGGHPGSMVSGFNLPGHVSIGEILNSLPRARYGG